MEGRQSLDNKQFSLVMLGTGTVIETVDQDGRIYRMPDYQRGETLNAIFRKLAGEEFKDKHIVSGVDTRGSQFDEKTAEGLMMLLKAVTDGKTDIRIAAHSRGAIETMMLLHKLEEIRNIAVDLHNNLELSKTVKIQAFDKKLSEIISRPSDRYNRAVTNVSDESETITETTSEPLNNSELGNSLGNSFVLVNYSEDEPSTKRSFETRQKKTTDFPNGYKKIDNTHMINVGTLLENLQSELNIELFLKDPVPGQKLLSTKRISNWALPEFFELPFIVNKATVIYQLHERSRFFEAALVRSNPRNTDKGFTVIPLPGHHGTASGFLSPQSGEENKIGSDSRGHLTRHVQKLTAAKLIDFFGAENFKTDSPLQEKGSELPKIEEMIQLYLSKSPLERLKYLLRVYKKIQSNEEKYKKYLFTTYTGLGYISPNERWMLVNNGGKISHQKMSEIPELNVQLENFLNYDHLSLEIQIQKNALAEIKGNNPYEKMKYLADGRKSLISLLEKLEDLHRINLERINPYILMVKDLWNNNLQKIDELHKSIISDLKSDFSNTIDARLKPARSEIKRQNDIINNFQEVIREFHETFNSLSDDNNLLENFENYNTYFSQLEAFMKNITDAQGDFKNLIIFKHPKSLENKVNNKLDKYYNLLHKNELQLEEITFSELFLLKNKERKDLKEHLNNNLGKLHLYLEALRDLKRQAFDIKQNLSRSYEYQMQKSRQLLESDDITDLARDCLQVIVNEVILINRSQTLPNERLVETLIVANEAANPLIRNTDSLFNRLSDQADFYLDASSEFRTLHRNLGIALLCLGVASLIAATTIGILTFGVGAIPIAAAYAAIIVGSTAVTGIPLFGVSAYSLFKSKEPVISHSLKKIS